MINVPKKELNKFMKNNPDNPAAQAIQAQLGTADDGSAKKSTSAEQEGQIFNSAENLTPDEAAKKVGILHNQILQGCIDIVNYSIELGHILYEQKHSLKHGEWLKWADQNIDLGYTQISHYISIYIKRDIVSQKMDEIREQGLNPSFRKMLTAITKKDEQTLEEYKKTSKKTEPYLPPRLRKEWNKNKKLEHEIKTLTDMYLDKEIDTNSLNSLTLKWNKDNPGNELYLGDVEKEIRQMDNELNPDIFKTSSLGKSNVIVSIDTELVNDFIEFGGNAGLIEHFIEEFIENYLIEQKASRKAS